MTNDKQRERRAKIKDMVINSPEISLTSVFDGDINEFEWEDKLVDFIESLLDKTRKEVARDILEFVYSERGLSGRKEIEQYIEDTYLKG